MERKIESFSLRSLGGRRFGYAAMPDNGDPHSAIVKAVQAAVHSLVRLDEHAAEGRPEAALLALQIGLRKARMVAMHEAHELAEERRAFYAPPATTDPAMDSELRAYVRELPPDARAALLAEAGAGKRPEILHALARFPAPVPEAEQARGLLRAQRDQDDPDGAQSLLDRAAALDWAESTTNAVERVMTDGMLAGQLPASVMA